MKTRSIEKPLMPLAAPSKSEAITMRIFAIIMNGRRQYRVTFRDARGVVSSYLPTKTAQRALRNLSR